MKHPVNISKLYIVKLSIPIFFANLAIPLVGLVDTGLMGHLGSEDWYTLAGISLNPISSIVLISGLGGIYTFIVRFFKARAVLAELDKNEPLSTPKAIDSVDDE